METSSEQGKFETSEYCFRGDEHELTGKRLSPSGCANGNFVWTGKVRNFGILFSGWRTWIVGKTVVPELKLGEIGKTGRCLDFILLEPRVLNIGQRTLIFGKHWNYAETGTPKITMKRENKMVGWDIFCLIF
jgi:hypothetical protein